MFYRAAKESNLYESARSVYMLFVLLKLREKVILLRNTNILYFNFVTDI